MGESDKWQGEPLYDAIVKKLRMMAPMSAEAAVVRGYIDWILALPWGVRTEDRLDVAEAERVLDHDHFGLHKVKERILALQGQTTQ